MKLNGITFCVLAVVALVGAYFGKLSNPFLIDDNQTIVDSVEIESLADSWVPEKDTPLAGRRIPSVSLALDYALFGRDPLGFHRTNLVFHLLNGLLVFLLLVALCQGPRAGDLLRDNAQPFAFFVSLLWVVHPLHVEPVLYASQRTELCFAFFALLTFLFAFRAMRTSSWFDLVATGVAGLAAAHSKESAILLIPLIVLLGRGLVSGSFGAFFKEHLRIVVALVPSLIAVVLIVQSQPRALSVEMYWDNVERGNDYLLTQGGIVWHYFKLVFLPLDQVAFYGHLVPAGSTAQKVGLAALAVLCVAGLFAIARFPRAGLFGAWILGLLAPASSFAVVHTEVGADRRMYLPLIGFLFLIALAILVLSTSKIPRKAAAIGAFVAMILLLVQTRVRADEYQDLERLWSLDLERYPQSAESDYSLGEIYRQRGEFDRAIQKYRDTLAKNDQHRMARTNLGALLFQAGQRDEGFQLLQEAAVMDGVFHEPWNNLGSALAMMQRWDEAEDAFRKGIQVAPDVPGLRMGLGKVLYFKNLKSEARNIFESLAKRREVLTPEESAELDQLLKAVR